MSQVQSSSQQQQQQQQNIAIVFSPIDEVLPYDSQAVTQHIMRPTDSLLPRHIVAYYQKVEEREEQLAKLRNHTQFRKFMHVYTADFESARHHLDFLGDITANSILTAIQKDPIYIKESTISSDVEACFEDLLERHNHTITQPSRILTEVHC
jgi:hypothetical protein